MANAEKGWLNILLVEDDKHDVTLFKMALGKIDGWRDLQRVQDAQEAIEYLRGLGPYADREKHPFPDLVVTDLKMPMAGGFELLKWIRSDAQCKELPVVVLSGSALEGDVTRAYELGANGFVNKPNQLEELANKLDSVLRFWMVCERPEARKF